MSTLLIAALLSTPAHAGQYYASGDPSSYMINANCAGCPKGDKVPLNPAVYEFLLSQDASFVRSHYAAMTDIDDNGTGKMGPIAQGFMTGATANLSYVYGKQEDFLNELTGASDLQGVLDADDDGVFFARAVARETADAANEMMAKKGWAQWSWGLRWETPDAWTLPAIAPVITLVVVDEGAKTVSVHLWGKDLVTTVRKASAVWDLSAVDGAFDPAASLDVEAVQAGAKPLEAKLPLVIDADTKVILGKQ